MEHEITLSEAYTVLGVSENASEREVRVAYKKLALEHHPDRSSEPDAKAKFQRVHAAYKAITDPDAFEDEEEFTDEAIFEMFDMMFDFLGPIGLTESDCDSEADHHDDYEYGSIEEELDEGHVEWLLHIYDWADPCANQSIAELIMAMRPKDVDGKYKHILDQLEAKLSRTGTGMRFTGARQQQRQQEEDLLAALFGMRGFPLGQDEDEEEDEDDYDGDMRAPPNDFLNALVMGMIQQDLMRSLGFAGLSGLDEDEDYDEDEDEDYDEDEDEDYEEEEDEEEGETVAPEQIQAVSAPATPAVAAAPAPASEAQPETTSQTFVLSAREQEDGGFNPRCGTRVLVNGGHPGRVAYAGPVHYAKGDFFGVVLDEPHGKTNGSVQGLQYFSCRPKHGMMVKASELQPLN